MLSILPYVSGPSVCPPWRSVCSGLLPIFLKLDYLSAWCGVLWVLFIFGHQILVQGIIGKCIFAYTWFIFHFADVFFSHAECIYFDKVTFVFSFFYASCSTGHIGENIAAWNIEISLPIFSSRIFVLSQHIFMYFIHLEFIFVYGVSWSSSFIFLHVAI